MTYCQPYRTVLLRAVTKMNNSRKQKGQIFVNIRQSQDSRLIPRSVSVQFEFDLPVCQSVDLVHNLAENEKRIAIDKSFTSY